MSSQEISRFSDELLDIMPQIVKGLFKKNKDALGAGKITVPQYLLLDLLVSRGSLKMKDVAGELGVSLPAATGLVNRLVKMLLAKRIFDPNDRRVIYIELTAKGRQIINELKASRRRAIENIFGKLSEKERQDYLTILRKIRKIIYPEKK